MNKQQLITLAREQGVSYSNLTKTQLASKLNITITPKPPLSEQQKKERKAAYACKHYQKNTLAINQKAAEYREANTEKSRQWKQDYLSKQSRKIIILLTHGVPYPFYIHASLHRVATDRGACRKWDRSMKAFARDLTKAAAAFRTRSRAAPRSPLAQSLADSGAFARDLTKAAAAFQTRSRAAPRSP